MLQPMKGYNFRFTVQEIELLDAIKLEMENDKSRMFHYQRITRTDVLKVLIRREWARIQKHYEDLKCQSEEKPVTTPASKAKKTRTLPKQRRNVTQS